MYIYAHTNSTTYMLWNDGSSSFPHRSVSYGNGRRGLHCYDTRQRMVRVGSRLGGSTSHDDDSGMDVSLVQEEACWVVRFVVTTTAVSTLYALLLSATDETIEHSTNIYNRSRGSLP